MPANTEGWIQPTAPLSMDDAYQEADMLAKRNQRRLKSVQVSSGVRQQSEVIDDLNVVAFVPKDGGDGHRFRVLSVGNLEAENAYLSRQRRQVAFLATAGECPHIVADSSCQNEVLRTRVHLDGKAACIGPFTVTEPFLEIDFGDGARRKVKLGQPFLVPVGPNNMGRVTLNFHVFLPGSDFEIGKGSRLADDFEDPVPAEVLTALAIGRDDAAQALFAGLPEDARTDKLKAEIAELRLKKAGSIEEGPLAVRDWLLTLKLVGLPGDAELLKIAGERIGSALVELARRSIRTLPDFHVGADLVRFSWNNPVEDGIEAGEAEFEKVYGQALTTTPIGGTREREVFVKIFPASEYTTQLVKEMRRRDAEAAAKAKEAQTQEEADQLWGEVRRQGDSLAELAFKISFAQKYMAPSPRLRRGIQNMQGGRRMMIQTAYCPAKQAFVDAHGAAEFTKRVATHCKEEAPVTGGLNGTRVTLTAECKAAFATGC